jgi:hypothetical protein
MQVRLTVGQVAALRYLAAERRISVAALTREAVDRLIEDDPRALIERALAVGGSASSGLGDVSENHDEYFAEAVLARFRR